MEIPYNKKVDLWSIGVILYLFLVGTLPYDSKSEKEIVRQTIHDPIPFFHKNFQKISDSAKKLLSNLLEKNMEKRYSIKELLEDSWIQRYQKHQKNSEKKGKLNESLFEFYSSYNEDIG